MFTVPLQRCASQYTLKPLSLCFCGILAFNFPNTLTTPAPMVDATVFMLFNHIRLKKEESKVADILFMSRYLKFER